MGIFQTISSICKNGPARTEDLHSKSSLPKAEIVIVEETSFGN